MPYFGTYGFLPPSDLHQLHHVATVRTVSLALDEFLTVSDSLDRVGFHFISIPETIVVSELLENIKTNVRNLIETITMPTRPSFTLTSFTTTSFNFEDTPTLDRIVTKFRDITETAITATGTPTIATPKSRALSETVTVSEALTRALSKARDLAESIGVSEALTRVLSKFRSIPGIEAVTLSEALTLARTRGKLLADTITVSETLERLTTKIRALAESITLGDALAMVRSKFRTPNVTQDISITDAVTSLLVKGKLLAETIVVSESLDMVRSKFRSLAESITITDLAERLGSVAKDLAESITVSDALAEIKTKFRTLAETITVTDQLTKVKPVVRTITETAITIIDAVARTVTTFVRTWLLTGQSSDFLDKLDNLTKSYITTKWTLVSPAIGSNRSTQISIDNFPFDKMRTYYIRIIEGKSNVTNHAPRQRLYQFETPIEFECSAMRLKKGEAFNELNSMINELMRIIGEYQKEDIFGVQGITFDSITPIGTDSSGKAIWTRSLKVIFHYFKVDKS